MEDAQEESTDEANFARDEFPACCGPLSCCGPVAEELRHTTSRLEKMVESCCGGMEPDELRELGELLRKLGDTLAT